jgi:molecular chaperone IbpA
MNTLDLSPLFRSTIGFDRVSRLLDSARNSGEAPTYPPYNIEKVEDDKYRLVFAVAGFGESDLTVTVKENTLLVAGKVEGDEDDVRFLHRGIAGRAFERRFELADHLVVEAGRLENGLLIIDLKREVPEALKPRSIPIASTNSKVIEQKVAA